jgi:hypothetical protein
MKISDLKETISEMWDEKEGKYIVPVMTGINVVFAWTWVVYIIKGVRAIYEIILKNIP